MKKHNAIFALCLALITFTSCSNDDSETATPQTARLSVELTDAPGDYDEVWVEVEDVLIKREATANEEEGWESLGNVHTGVYDLLTLTGGNTQLLADVELPAGYLDQLRLVLGDNNNVVVNETSYTLRTPSAQQSGLKLQVNQELEPDTEYNFILDFDVDKSVVKTGAGGNYNLHPVMRLSAQAVTGSVVGSVHPTTHQALVKAQKGDTEVSAYTNDEGEFKLVGLPAGTYRITVTPDPASGFEEVVRNNVEVTVANSRDLDVIYLQ